MKVDEYLNLVAYKAPHKIGEDFSDCWFSAFDGSYITHVGMEDSVKYLADLEITDDLTHGVGFSPKDGKWYGWSHRAIYGFEVGSTCQKGDCHYRAGNVEDELAAAIEFWAGDNKDNVAANLDDEGVIQVTWVYDGDTPNEKLRDTISGVSWGEPPYATGRGEWVAKTLDDAKQMAIDFNDGVS